MLKTNKQLVIFAAGVMVGLIVHYAMMKKQTG